VTERAERAVRQGHPWVYTDSFTEVATGQPGDLGVIFDRRGRFLAIGLWDPTSAIRFRVLQMGQPAPIDRAWFAQKLQQAAERRESLVKAGHTGYRWVHGENDSLPGLILDRYDQTVVLKLYTLAWLPYLELLTSLIQEIFNPEQGVLRLSRNIQANCKLQGYQDGQMLWGSEPAGPVLFQEHGLTFEAEVCQGQKTGFFLDQRENRQRLGELVQGGRVLNVFSFSGGFSVYAARGGCREVTSLDISAHALASAQRNFSHNPGLTTDHHLMQGDAFAELTRLAQGGVAFDAVILDPPSFAPRHQNRPQALASYRRIIQLGLRVLAPGGLLVAASCSAHVTALEFQELVAEVLAVRGFRLLDFTGHALDHPVTFLEANYLKCWFGYVE